MSKRFVPIAEYYAGLGNKHGAPVVKCPDFWQCGEYADMARVGSTPTKVELRCKYHARKTEEREGREMLANHGARSLEALAELGARVLLAFHREYPFDDSGEGAYRLKDAVRAAVSELGLATCCTFHATGGPLRMSCGGDKA